MGVEYQPRIRTIFECDHLRSVVRLDEGGWFHISYDGRAAGRCEAGVYEVMVATQDHTIRRLVRDDD